MVFNKYTLVLLCLFSIALGQEKFKIVLDAGHGGHDAGTYHHGLKEKEVVLEVVLMVGKALEKYPDIQVVYTRKTDVFVELFQRAQIANKAKANLFLSVHCNGHHTYTPKGTETFVLGLSKNASNLEVVKKENAVVQLETNTKDKYQGYDPNSPQSLIGISLLQEEFIDQSIILASKIQKSFGNHHDLYNRGVKQGPFLVLNQTAMPSVLTEIGFISNKEDNNFLKSFEGKQKIADAITEAVLAYKRAYYGGSPEPDKQMLVSEILTADTQVEKPKEEVQKVEQTLPSDKVDTEQKLFNKVVYKVQVRASQSPMNTKGTLFEGLTEVDVYQEAGFYKYTTKLAYRMVDAQNNLKSVRGKGYKDAFIVAFFEDKKISLQEAQKLEK